MPHTAPVQAAPRSNLPLPPGALIGFVAAALAVTLIAFFSYRALQARSVSAGRVSDTLQVISQLEGLLSSVKDAETSQRGYMLTGEEPYLDPFNGAKAELATRIKTLRNLARGDERQMERIELLQQLAGEKFNELGQTIAMRRAGDAAGALAIVRSNQGKATMDRMRATVAEMQTQQQAELTARRLEWEDAASFSDLVTWGGSALLLVLIAAAAGMASRDFRVREDSNWVRAGLVELGVRLQGDLRLEVLGEKVLSFLAGYLQAQIGAVYIVQSDGSFRRFAAYALPADAQDDALRPGDGLLGQAAKDQRTLHVREVPPGYLPVSSAAGSAQPVELLLVPALLDGRVHAVLELGFFRHVLPVDLELLARASESLALAVRSSKDRTRLEELLEETQRQAEELQAQQEELRVSNEELEQQGRVLKVSQAQMEAQQAELEQTNSQLEEQTQQLENQKEDLQRAQSTLQQKADELEQASRYKSEFLANMSHELRTPLNSTLILAKLLADNKAGNLSEEQVKFAQTISAAGNDLLALINDILDLSKIEAGQMTVQIEAMHVARAVDGLVKPLQPQAAQKGLRLNVAIEPGVPESLQTDPQRFGQILKNLLSNALKFTEQGDVSLRAWANTDGTVSFAVRDTGIGIAEHQQGIVFEAFRQADGSTHRKYGGTGLGLSISRDLARLLGGNIALKSKPGEGSEFTLTLPVAYAGAAQAPAAPPAPAPAPALTSPPLLPAAVPAPKATVLPATPDDRAELAQGGRVILVIEDDTRFALILRDLAHELGFQCIVTHSAGSGLAAATQYVPSAIVLDVNLPDHSGLGVLDQLKRNPQTRHIPVHVVSVADYAHEALELGAIGYALKPVKREELVTAFQRLEAKFTQSTRRVLVVEDDARQRESIGRLLGTGEVEITAVDSAQAALQALGGTTFDCMVMDLNLPDLSGYELLQKMAEQGDVAFPPVIVYTGRTIPREEEERLRRFSRSIIVKDARSPERLLDEVTLFLHQVESKLPADSQRLLQLARDRESSFENRRILVVEDDVRNIFALSSVLEPKGAKVEIARNGREALEHLARSKAPGGAPVDLVLMDIMMPEMDGLTAMREIRRQAEFQKLPIIALTAKAMKDDQEKCLSAGANDYIAKPLDVEKLLSLVRVWMPK
ncbi:MAG: response regulator [Aquabacterium sp.]|nr:MAG: response regulator [Aquabacterium sp.]